MGMIREYRNGLCMLHGVHRIFSPSNHPYGFVVLMSRFAGDDGMPEKDYHAIHAWCRARFSSDVWFEDDYAFWFKQVDDALEFKLRWM